MKTAMKKLTKKAATQIIHSILPGAKVETSHEYDLIGTYVAKTPGMTIKCYYDHIMPWKHIELHIDVNAPRSITLLYNPETLERDTKAEWNEWEKARTEWDEQWAEIHL